MNHDMTHCLDYRKSVCPRDCFRAKLNEDLKRRRDLDLLPISYASFRGGSECPLGKKVKP